MNPQKKLKLILASLKDREIIKYFEVLSGQFPDQFKKTIRQISFNCYESVCEFRTKLVSGYGKNSNESYVNSVRTLIELLADDSKLHTIMKDALKIIQHHAAPDLQQQQQTKGLMNGDRNHQGSMKNISLHASIKGNDKKTSLKQQIFEYLNLDNLKISNPNSLKAKPKQIDSEDRPILQQVLRRNKQLQQRILQTKQENVRLKSQLRQVQARKQNQLVQNSNVSQQMQQDSELMRSSTKQLTPYSNSKQRQSFQPLKVRTNNYLNMSQDSKQIQKSKMRSVSVQASQTQKYLMPSKKIAVPKLNLQVLPNYHGKSNKSLNQSLMEVYQKTHLK